MKTMIAVFPDEQKANSAIEHLWNLGFKASDMSIIVKGKENAHEIRGDKGGEAVRDAFTGATAGGFVGGLAGLLVGLSAVIVPGVGAFLIGGPIAAALGLTGAAAIAISGAATGILAGGLVGALVNIGIPESVAKVYETSIKKGGILLAVPVNTDEDQKEVERVFDMHDAGQVRTLEGFRTLR